MRKLKFPSVFLKTPEGIKVGEEALGTPSAVRWMESLDDLVELYPHFIRHVEEKFGVKVSAISIPLELWEQVRRGGKVPAKFRKMGEVCGRELKVFPQGLVILRHLKETGRVEGDVFLILDGGFKTLNVSVTDGEELRFVKSYYNQLGLRVLITEIFREEVKKIDPEVTSSAPVLTRYFLEGKMPAGFKTVDLSKEKRRALGIFLEMLVDTLKKDLTRAGAVYDGILIAGGLSYYLEPGMIRTDRKVFVAPDREFANAVAMCYFTGEPVLDLGFSDAKVCIPSERIKTPIPVRKDEQGCKGS